MAQDVDVAARDLDPERQCPCNMRIAVPQDVQDAQAVDRLPDAKNELDKLARRSGFPDGGALLDRVERWQHDIRRAYLTLVPA